jgi:hypothetical protein
MSYKETLNIEWFDVLHKLPNDGDYVYFQRFDKYIETGYFSKESNSRSSEASDIFWFEDGETEFEVNEVTFWALVPEIKGVIKGV